MGEVCKIPGTVPLVSGGVAVGGKCKVPGTRCRERYQHLKGSFQRQYFSYLFKNVQNFYIS